MYVVFGVTGHTGKIVAETLLAQKKPVRVVVRSEAKGVPWKARGAEVAVATVEDAASVEKALKGADGAYVLLPPDYASKDNLGDKQRQIDSLAKAIPASGVKHVVLLSSVGAQHAEGTGPVRSLHVAEKRFAATGVPCTFLRAPYFLENFGSALGTVTSDGVLYAMFERKIPMIATKDIGLTAARLLVEGPSTPNVVNLHGPAEYAPSDVAAALGKILGKPVKAVLVPEAGRVAALTGAGLTEDMAKLFAEMAAGITSGLMAFETTGARDAKGTTSLDEVLRGLLGK